MDLLHGEITDSVLNAAYRVHNELGYGFLEKVYENALGIELREMGHQISQQERVEVFYRGKSVGEYYADLVIDSKVVLELKAAKALASEHQAQLLNYLRATNYEVGLLLNFGTSMKFKRIIMTNDYS